MGDIAEAAAPEAKQAEATAEGAASAAPTPAGPPGGPGGDDGADAVGFATKLAQQASAEANKMSLGESRDLQIRRMQSEKRYAGRVAEKRRARNLTMGQYARAVEKRAVELAQPGGGGEAEDVAKGHMDQAKLEGQEHQEQLQLAHTKSRKAYASRVAEKRLKKGMSIGNMAREEGVDRHWIEKPRVFRRRTAGMLAATFLPVGLYGFIFTEMGYGATCFRTLNSLGEVGEALKMSVAAVIFLLYMNDVSYWKVSVCCAGRVGDTLAKASKLLCLLAAVAAGAMSFRDYPYLPLLLFIGSIPLLLWFLRARVYPAPGLEPDATKRAGQCHMHCFVRSVGWVSIINGSVAFLTALGWASYHNFFWGDDTKRSFKGRLTAGNGSKPMDSVCLARCGADVVMAAQSCSLEVCVSVWNSTACLAQPDGYAAAACQSTACQAAMVNDPTAYCLAAFLLYSSQFVASLAMVMFGAVAIMLHRSIQHDMEEEAGDVNPVIKMLTTIGLSSFTIIWAAASIGGASMQIGNAVMALGLLCIIISAVLMGATFGWQELNVELKKVSLVRSMGDSFKSNFAKAMLVLMAGPALVLYFLVSCVNQLARRTVLFPCTKKLEKPTEEGQDGNDGDETTVLDETKLWMTVRGHKQFQQLKNWDWTAVLRGVVVIGILYFALSVGAGKLTTVFLSWLNSTLAQTELAIVTVIFVCVGLGMFLLPPVPGVPVYLTGGIVLTKAAERYFRPADDPAVDGMSADTTYFWIGTAYACFFAFVCKLLAIAMQQKLIGGLLGNRVAVRSMIGVNSATIKAIKLILQDERPLTKGKVMILVGGPDWPTSVTTGILGISLLPMIIGSLPLIVPLSLTTAAGSLMLKANSGGIWSSISAMTLTLAVMAQSLSLVGAAMEIEKVKSTRQDEMDAMEDDEEVAALDKEADAQQKSYDSATHWRALPTAVKLLLSTAAMATSVATVLFGSMGESCFESIEVTAELSKPPINGELLNLIKPTGWLALLFEAIGIVLFKAFQLWAKREVKNLRLLKQHDISKLKVVLQIKGRIGPTWMGVRTRRLEGRQRALEKQRQQSKLEVLHTAVADLKGSDNKAQLIMFATPLVLHFFLAAVLFLWHDASWRVMVVWIFTGVFSLLVIACTCCGQVPSAEERRAALAAMPAFKLKQAANAAGVQPVAIGSPVWSKEQTIALILELEASGGDGQREPSTGERQDATMPQIFAALWFGPFLVALLPATFMAYGSQSFMAGSLGDSFFMVGLWSIGWLYLIYHFNTEHMQPIQLKQRLESLPRSVLTNIKFLSVLYEAYSLCAFTAIRAVPWQVMTLPNFIPTGYELKDLFLPAFVDQQKLFEGLDTPGSTSRVVIPFVEYELTTSIHVFAFQVAYMAVPAIFVMYSFLRNRQHYSSIFIQIFFDILSLPLITMFLSIFSCVGADVWMNELDGGDGSDGGFRRVCDESVSYQADYCLDIAPHLGCFEGEHMSQFIFPVTLLAPPYVFAAYHLQSMQQAKQSVVVIDGLSRITSFQIKILLAFMTQAFGDCHPKIVVFTVCITMFSQLLWMGFGGSSWRVVTEDTDKVKVRVHFDPMSMLLKNFHYRYKEKLDALEVKVDPATGHTHLRIAVSHDDEDSTRCLQCCKRGTAVDQSQTELQQLTSGASEDETMNAHRATHPTAWVSTVGYDEETLIERELDFSPRIYSNVLIIHIVKLFGRVGALVNGLFAAGLLIFNTEKTSQFKCSTGAEWTPLRSLAAKYMFWNESGLSLAEVKDRCGCYAERGIEFGNDRTSTVAGEAVCVEVCGSATLFWCWLSANGALFVLAFLVYHRKKNGSLLLAVKTCCCTVKRYELSLSQRQTKWTHGAFWQKMRPLDFRRRNREKKKNKEEREKEREEEREQEEHLLKRHCANIHEVNDRGIVAEVDYPVVQRRIRTLTEVSKMLRKRKDYQSKKVWAPNEFTHQWNWIAPSVDDDLNVIFEKQMKDGLDVYPNENHDGQQIEDATLKMLLEADGFETKREDRLHNIDNTPRTKSNPWYWFRDFFQLNGLYGPDSWITDYFVEKCLHNQNRKTRILLVKPAKQDPDDHFSGLRLNVCDLDPQTEGGDRILSKLEAIHDRAANGTCKIRRRKRCCKLYVTQPDPNVIVCNRGCGCVYISYHKFSWVQMGPPLPNAKIVALRLRGKMRYSSFQSKINVVTSHHLGIDKLDLCSLRLEGEAGCLSRKPAVCAICLATSATSCVCADTQTSEADRYFYQLEQSLPNNVAKPWPSITEDGVQQLGRVLPILCVSCGQPTSKTCLCERTESNQNRFKPCADAMVEGIRKALRVPGCRIKDVDISKCHFSPTGILSLARMLQEMQDPPVTKPVDVVHHYRYGVQQLTIDSTGTWHWRVKQDGRKHGDKYKPKTYTLMAESDQLDLSRKNLGDEDVALLCKWLELQHARLCKSKKDEDKQLSEPFNVTSIDLSRNHIREHGKRILSDTLLNLGKRILSDTLLNFDDKVIDIQRLKVDMGDEDPHITTSNSITLEIGTKALPTKESKEQWKKMNPSDLYFVAGWLQSPFSKTARIDLSGNHVFGTADIGYQRASKLLCSTDCGDAQDHPCFDDKGWRMLCQWAVDTSPDRVKGKQLILQDTGLGPHGLQILADALKGQVGHGLSEVDISKNYILGHMNTPLGIRRHVPDGCSRGWDAFCEILETDVEIDVVRASDIGMGPLAYRRLADALDTRASNLMREWLRSLGIDAVCTYKDPTCGLPPSRIGGFDWHLPGIKWQPVTCIQQLEDLMDEDAGGSFDDLYDMLEAFCHDTGISVEKFDAMVSSLAERVEMRAGAGSVCTQSQSPIRRTPKRDILIDVLANPVKSSFEMQQGLARLMELDGLKNNKLPICGLYHDDHGGIRLQDRKLGSTDCKILAHHLACSPESANKDFDLSYNPDLLTMKGVQAKDKLKNKVEQVKKLIAAANVLATKLVDLKTVSQPFLDLCVALAPLKVQRYSMDQTGLGPQELDVIVSYMLDKGTGFATSIKHISLRKNDITGTCQTEAKEAGFPRGLKYDVDTEPLKKLGVAMQAMPLIESLDMSKCNMGVKAARAFADWPAVGKLQTLNLSENPLCVGGELDNVVNTGPLLETPFELMCHAYLAPSCIVKLRLENIEGFRSTDLEQMSDAILSADANMSGTLKSLSLQNNTLIAADPSFDDEPGSNSYAGVIKLIEKLPAQLTELILCECGLDSECATKLSDALEDTNRTFLHELTHLDISDNPLFLGDKHQRTDIGWTRLGKAVREGCPQLQSLSARIIGGPKNLEGEEQLHFRDSLSSADHFSLELDEQPRKSRGSDQDGAEIMGTLCSLLGEVSGESDPWLDLANEVRSHWEALGWTEESWKGTAPEPATEQMDWNQLTEQQRKAAEELGYNEHSWKEPEYVRLELFGRDWATRSTFGNLNSKLVKLDLRGNRLGVGGKETVATLLAHGNLSWLCIDLGRHYTTVLENSVKKLSLSNKKLEGIDARVVAGWIQGCNRRSVRNLKSLDLRHNNIVGTKTERDINLGAMATLFAALQDSLVQTLYINRNGLSGTHHVIQVDEWSYLNDWDKPLMEGGPAERMLLEALVEHRERKYNALEKAIPHLRDLDADKGNRKWNRTWNNAWDPTWNYGIMRRDPTPQDEPHFVWGGMNLQWNEDLKKWVGKNSRLHFPRDDSGTPVAGVKPEALVAVPCPGLQDEILDLFRHTHHPLGDLHPEVALASAPSYLNEDPEPHFAFL